MIEIIRTNLSFMLRVYCASTDLPLGHRLMDTLPSGTLLDARAGKSVLRIHAPTVKYFDPEMGHITSSHNLLARSRHMTVPNFKREGKLQMS